MPTEHNAKYGIVHRNLRERWALAIARGGVDCARCGEPIPPGTPSNKWDLGHIDGTLKHAGPEHIRCNRQTLTHAKQAAADFTPTRLEWESPPPAKPQLCEHMQRGERHGRLCCGNSRDW